MEERIPVNLITGFLGVGKTTTVRHLLDTHPAEERWAVLVNEHDQMVLKSGKEHIFEVDIHPCFVDLDAGEWVIQNAANSGVGSYLIALAKMRGLKTVNVVRRASSRSSR